MFSRWLLYPFLVLCTLGLICVGVFALIVGLLYPNLPSLEVLTDYRPKIPLKVLTSEGVLIGEFGGERRAVLKLAAVPAPMRQAILAAEDERFYQHGGVDYQGVLRAALSNLSAGGAKEGASTITMQVARNFFLSNEKTITRKLSEILLALKIEHNLSKDQILELYINQIFLGQRAYGFGAAANAYYSKPLDQLTVAEMAMLAGLPKAPSRYNPVVNPKRAAQRQQYVLRRMRDLHFLAEAQYQEAIRNPGTVVPEHLSFGLRAEYVAEMARQYMFETYGDAAYVGGYKVFTTLTKPNQMAAYLALRKGVIEYDRRHGYRGPEAYAKVAQNGGGEEALEEALAEKENNDNLLPAVVLEASPQSVRAYAKGGETITIEGDGLKFAQKMLLDKAPEATRIRRGAVIRIVQDPKGPWQITQLPAVEAALVGIDPKDGAIRALVGGFDFNSSKFNHVTQAWRQPGSSFKPFIYSAALEKNLTAATVLEDAPLVVDAQQTGGELWEPKNFEDQYSGPIRLRTALIKSKNMVSIRVLQAIGTQYAQDYITRFGFDPKMHPAYLSMALGGGLVTPLQMGAAFSIFANNGYRTRPYFIERVLDQRDNVISQAKPVVAAQDAEQVIDPRNVFIMGSLMRDVIRFGTATKALALGRKDIAGKTGTTNELVDAWFAGFHPTMVAIAWLGFDNPSPLGSKETGGQAALPIWIDYMGKVLKGVPEAKFPAPEGVVQATIDPLTGKRDNTSPTKISEYFYKENVPALQPTVPVLEIRPDTAEKSTEEIKNQLF
jgi:penicillin-binding protein 1A